MSDKKAAIYIRVSSREQVELGESLRRQEEQLIQYMKMKGITDYDVISDRGISGFKDSRPGFLKLVKLCESKQVDLVAVYDMSRLSRSIRTTLAFIEDTVQKNNIEFVCLKQDIDTSTPMGKAFLVITSLFAQLYRDEISYKTKQAIEHKKENGFKVGRFNPYGTQVASDGKLSVNQYERENIDLMVKMKSENTSYAAIASHLNRTGVKSRNNCRWYAQTVKNILCRNTEKN